MGRLTKRERKDIEQVAETYQRGDLYRCLHRVGDDDVKASVEDALTDLLDPLTFRKVVAVFKIATGDVD
jgi:hypothetical protein